MLKLTKTGIGLLTRQYRSVLKKCWAINVGIFSMLGKMVSAATHALTGGTSSFFRRNNEDVMDGFLGSHVLVSRMLKYGLLSTTVLGAALVPNEAGARAFQNQSVTDGRTIAGFSGDYDGAATMYDAAGNYTVLANFVNNIGTCGGCWGPAISVQGNAVMNKIMGNFVGNSVGSYGGAIYNTRTINTLIGDFDGNSGGNEGGAIYNRGGTINSLSADFRNNNTNSHGGAVDNEGTITALNGDFNGNSSVFNGGAIYNTGTIAALTGSFETNSSGAKGGAIALNDGGKITDLTADFTGNSTGEKGAAIYNAGTITNLVGDFRKNYINSASAALGGSIYNSGGTINNLTSNFIENSATSSANYAQGGGVFNNTTLGAVTADFTNNSAITTASDANGYAIGGAVYNTGVGSITSITGNFVGNKVEANSGSNGNMYAASQGGAIANYVRSTSGTPTIDTISGDFTNNSVSSRIYSVGGAVSNMASRSDEGEDIIATINKIDGNFKGNRSEAGNGSFGGAVSNYAEGTNTTAEIKEIKGNFENNFAGFGTVYNAQTSDGTAIIGSIIGDFINNKTFNQGSAIYNSGTIRAVTGNFIGNDVGKDAPWRSKGAIYNDGGTIGLAATDRNITFYNNTTTDNSGNVTYDDINNVDGIVNLNANGGQSISFGGNVIQSDSGTININTDNLVGGTYVFNNKIHRGNINIGSSTATNATTVKMGKITQTDGSETTGQLNDIATLTNYAENSILDTQNETIEAQNVTTLYLANAMKLYIDAKLSGSGNTADTINATNVYSGSSGTTAPVAGSLVIDKINLVDTAYSDSGATAEIEIAEEDSDLATAYTVSDNVLKNNNMNYFTKVEYDNGKIIFSDKLINQSSLDENLNNYYTKLVVAGEKQTSNVITQKKKTVIPDLIGDLMRRPATGCGYIINWRQLHSDAGDSGTSPE